MCDTNVNCLNCSVCDWCVDCVSCNMCEDCTNCNGCGCCNNCYYCIDCGWLNNAYNCKKTVGTKEHPLEYYVNNVFVGKKRFELIIKMIEIYD